MGLGRQKKPSKQINRFLKRHEPITKWDGSWAAKMVFQSGIKAYFAGQTLGDCPHKAPQARQTWLDGFNAGRQTDRLIGGIDAHRQHVRLRSFTKS
jgi:ribosome modulation factor